jgi:hypothetical protein
LTLNKAELKNSLIDLYNKSREGEGVSDEFFAEEMSNIIDTFVRSGLVATTVIGVQSGGSTVFGTGKVT